MCVYMEISTITAKQYGLQHSLENPHQQNARLNYGSAKIPGVLSAKSFAVEFIDFSVNTSDILDTAHVKNAIRTFLVIS